MWARRPLDPNDARAYNVPAHRGRLPRFAYDGVRFFTRGTPIEAVMHSELGSATFVSGLI